MKMFLTEAEIQAYAHGLQRMWDAFNYAASEENIDLKMALGKYGKWLDDVINPWRYSNVGVFKPRIYEFPIPPGLEMLKDQKEE
jgi:hypothetical protein